MLCLFVLSMAMLIAGCVPGDGSNTEEKKAGFISGVWHGWIAPISLILGFFDKNVRVYEVFNKGWGYDFGFYIAIISGFGGISFFRKKRRR
ncbi:MAG: hypothetical protein GX974_10345 [Clostridiales bacterium]|nr:hypothetical protein [Clostridiales bacterium]